MRARTPVFSKNVGFPQNQLQIQAGKCTVGDIEGLRFISFGAFKCQLALTSLVFGSFTSQIIAKEIP